MATRRQWEWDRDKEYVEFVCITVTMAVRPWRSYSGGYEEFSVLVCDAV
jgi:hypothetical protein